MIHHIVSGKKLGLTVGALAALLASSVPASAAPSDAPPVVDQGASSSPSGASCRTFVFQVLQNPGDSTRKSVWGQLCHVGSLTSAKPVQLLIHGGAYNHTYWDSSFRPEQYNYVKQATALGYATLNIDRLGNGNSDRPDPATLDFNVAGFVAHQVVSALRAGSLGPAFHKVIINGHSMGAAAAENEAENWDDIDALILSGIGHDLSPGVQQTVGGKLYPAELDPKFAGQIQTGYLTTVPGQRASAFILPGLVEPGMVAQEESTLKDVLSPNELISLLQDSYNPTLTPKIKAPVLFVQGQYDELWCLNTGNCNTDPTSAAEASFYAPGTSFTRVIIPLAGHSINSSVTAPIFYGTTFAWLAFKGLSR
jgi:pimeloyl-ACP methyl ester carboxylesterase